MSEDQVMAPEAVEETNVVVETETVETESKIQSLEDALGEIKKLRRENAKRRVDAKDVEDAKKWREHLDAQKSEMEKLLETKAELEEKLAAKEYTELQREIARQYELDPDLTEFVTGSTEDEMKAKAEKLAAKAAKAAPPDAYAGNRGTPVVSKTNPGGSFLLGLAKEWS